MINYKIATNKDFFQVETDKQGGGVMTATYPRLCQVVAVSDNGFQILEQNGKIFLYSGKLENTKIEGIAYTDVYLFVEKLNEIVYNNIPAVSSTPSTTETLLQEIADSVKVISSETLPMDEVLPAGTYTKLQLETTYGNGKKVCAINGYTENGLDEMAITVLGDASDTFVPNINKGDSTRNLKGYTEMVDFTLKLQSPSRIFITFFENLT